MVGSSPAGSVSSVVPIEIHGPLPLKIVINWAAQLAECNKTVSKAGGSLFTALRVMTDEGGEWILDLDYDDMAVTDDTEEGL